MIKCPWDGRTFIPRKTGGKTQLFCSTTCRNTHRAALFAYAEEQERSGLIKMGDLRAAHDRKHGLQRDGRRNGDVLDNLPLFSVLKEKGGEESGAMPQFSPARSEEEAENTHYIGDESSLLLPTKETIEQPEDEQE